MLPCKHSTKFCKKNLNKLSPKREKFGENFGPRDATRHVRAFDRLDAKYSL